jgi:hypothetical protein
VSDIEIKSRLVCLKRPHNINMDASRIFKKLTAGCFGGRRPVVKPRGRWEGAIRRDTVGCLQIIQNWKAAESKREVCRKDIGKTMAQKWAK